VIARLILLAALLPFTALAQLELTLYNTATNTETPLNLAQPFDVGSAAACQTITPRLRIHNIGSTTVEIQTLEVTVTGATPAGVFKTDSHDPLPGSSFLIASASFRDIWIDFSPGAPGQYTATLAVNSLTLELTGEGITAPTVTDSAGKSYCPGRDLIYVGRTQVGTTIQSTLTLGNPTPNAVSATVTGADFGPSAAVAVGPGASQTIQLTFTPSIPNTETATLTIGSLVYNLSGDGFAAPLLQPALQLSSNANLSSNQAQVSISLAAAASATTAGQLTLAFQPASNLTDDPNIVFPATGTRTMSVVVNPGDTAIHFQAGDPNQCTFQTGTTAGTITFTLTIGSATATASTTIAPAIVSLDLSSAVPATDSILLTLAGFDNTHAASLLAFTFYDPTGKAITPGLIQSNVSSPFANYYQANPRAGGTFSLQATFPVSGDITKVSAVDVQFTNPAGVASTARLPVK